MRAVNQLNGSLRRVTAPTVLAALAFIAAGVAHAADSAVPPLDARVRYETQQVYTNGTTRTDTWQERLVRRGETVWTERVLPPAAPHAEHEHAEAAGHKHFDVDRAARWLQRDDDGTLKLRYVSAASREVVNVPKAEWGAVGFDGRYDAAAYLVPRSVVERMPLAPKEPAVGDARWHVEQAGGWTHRILWSADRQVALRIESKRDDGSLRRSVIVEPAASPVADASLPWRQLSGYADREYDDFLD